MPEVVFCKSVNYFALMHQDMSERTSDWPEKEFVNALETIKSYLIEDSSYTYLLLAEVLNIVAKIQKK